MSRRAWLQRQTKERLGLTIRQMARYWNGNGRAEIDLMADLIHGSYFGECKWRANSLTGLSLSALQAKVVSLPEARWRNKPRHILFALGSFPSELLQLASDPAERLHLVRD